MARKRKHDPNDDDNTGKRLKLTTASGSILAVKVAPPSIPEVKATEILEETDKHKKGSSKVDKDHGSTRPRRPRINKLAPPRPFPTMPTSVSATGPRSAHMEGKNFICLTRKTPLGSYMRRCKDLIVKDGYMTLYLSAMGAAIPHLLHLSLALPPILPFSADEIRTEITTGTVEVQDEVLPEDEDEDITYQTRGKSTLKIVLIIGDGEFAGDRGDSHKKTKGNRGVHRGARGNNKDATGKDKGKATQRDMEDVVFQEPAQESMEML